MSFSALSTPEDVLDLVHRPLVDVLLKHLPHLLGDLYPPVSVPPPYQALLLLLVLVHLHPSPD